MESLVSHQHSLFEGLTDIHSRSVTSAIELLSTESKQETHGSVYTRVEVVEFILDLVGYTADRPLYQYQILEPAFGGGDFLLPIIGRLLSAWRSVESVIDNVIDDLGDCIVAVELHRDTFTTTRAKVYEYLISKDIPMEYATVLIERWLIQGDFLLEHIEKQFDFIVGNPPYVRQEMIPAVLLAAYRHRYTTIYDRADLYIPFIERSLLLLTQCGHLGFICADRWMKNRYGGPLRNLIDEGFYLKVYVDMVDTPAFQSEVSTYPAITVISREKQGITRVAHRPSIDRATLLNLAQELRTNRLLSNKGLVHELAKVTNKSEPWLLESSDQLAVLRRLEQKLPTLEEAGCKVGIGVATGADKAFIGQYNELDVEPDRKLPLVTTNDIRSGEVQWLGQGIINPFAEDGSLIRLGDYPRLNRYLMARQEVIANRHCARRTPTNWYRTIDRIDLSLVKKSKLLIPDIKGEPHVVFESGEFYPHHNLYYVTSEDWDLKALQAVLLSAVARLFVSTYSTKMRSGYLRFQAQYLRRIRIPYWHTVPASLRLQLVEAAKSLDLQACNRAAFSLYGLTHKECSVLGGNEE